VLFGRTFLSWYGEEFVEAYNPMLFLVIGQVVNALCGSVGYLMTMTGNQNNVLYVVSGASILSITLNLILIPVLGATGAAISSATALSAWNIILYIIILKKLKIRASIF
jgi:O-antigen/teichoic acid export membrane protein